MFLLWLLIPAWLGAADLSFNRDIRPILSEQCFHCHGPDPNNRKANLRLDLPNAAIPSAKIVARITHQNKALRMPPAYANKDALPQADIDKLKSWLDQGAKYEGHWAFIPPERTQNATVDSLVIAKLKQANLQLSPPANKAILLRRL
ncbi:MAG: c-type cytochrome domain-containing protein, partial [Chloroflexia bacterium]